jgi:hypothetical protein
LIEEEMTFEELSSKLGGLVFDDGPDLIRRNSNSQIPATANNPFSDVASSARISVCSPIDSGDVTLDFIRIPELLEPLDAPYKG